MKVQKQHVYRKTLHNNVTTQVRVVQVLKLQPHSCLLWLYYFGRNTSVNATLANQTKKNLSEGDLLLLDCNPACWWRNKGKSERIPG